MASENFDGVTPPALPSDWVATNAQGPPPLWVTSNSGRTNAACLFTSQCSSIDDPGEVSDKRLDSPQFSFFESGPARLTFRHNFNFEASDTNPNLGFDGGVLEISTDGGNTFQDILVAGGSFFIGGYNRTISTDRGSPIAGLRAWSGNSEGFVTTVVNVPSGSDVAGYGGGWLAIPRAPMRVGGLTRLISAILGAEAHANAVFTDAHGSPQLRHRHLRQRLQLRLSATPTATATGNSYSYSYRYGYIHDDAPVTATATATPTLRPRRGRHLPHGLT